MGTVPTPPAPSPPPLLHRRYSPPPPPTCLPPAYPPTPPPPPRQAGCWCPVGWAVRRRRLRLVGKRCGWAQVTDGEPALGGSLLSMADMLLAAWYGRAVALLLTRVRSPSLSSLKPPAHTTLRMFFQARANPMVKSRYHQRIKISGVS